MGVCVICVTFLSVSVCQSLHVFVCTDIYVEPVCLPVPRLPSSLMFNLLSGFLP